MNRRCYGSQKNRGDVSETVEVDLDCLVVVGVLGTCEQGDQAGRTHPLRQINVHQCLSENALLNPASPSPRAGVGGFTGFDGFEEEVFQRRLRAA